MVDTSTFANNLVFCLNGTSACLEHVDPTMLLIDYLRSPEVGLTGTKLVCGEGGCGACTVVMAHKDRRTGQVVERPVNACLRPLCAVDGTIITTTEGLGSTHTGHLNPILEMPPVNSFPSGFVITKVLIPFTSKGSIVQTYKVARRFQNAHALVNAGFHCEFGPSTEVERATLIFGGIGRLPISAERTATFLREKLWTRATFDAAVQVLREEITAHIVLKLEDGVSTEYRKALAKALFYKYFVYVATQIAPREILPDEMSAGQPWERKVSSGIHGYVEAPFFEGEPLQSRISPVSMNPGTPSYAVARGCTRSTHA